MSVAYCGISHWLLFSSLVLTIVALVLAWRGSAKESIICLGFVLLQVVVASLTFCPQGVPVIGGAIGADAPIRRLIGIGLRAKGK